jgi:hypothetical protein
VFFDVPLKQKTAILGLIKPIPNAIFGVFEHKGSKFVFCVDPIVDVHSRRFASMYFCAYSVVTDAKTGATVVPKLRIRTQDDTPKLAEYFVKELILLASQGKVTLRKGNVPKRLVSDDVVKRRKQATAEQRNSSGAILYRKGKGQGHVDPLRNSGVSYAYIDASRKIYGCTVNVNNHRCIMSESIAYYMDGTGISVYGDNRDRRPLEQGWHQNSYKNKK